MIDTRNPVSEAVQKPQYYDGAILNWKVIEEQVIYYRTHMDVFIEDAFAPVKLTPIQHVIARGVGNATTSAVVAPRGYGKTWLTAFIAVSLGCLYPGTSILVVAPTADQATRIAEKIRDLCNENENFRNEIKPTNAKTYVSISKDESMVTLKNGSTICSVPLARARGRRAKMVIVDEARDVDMDVLRAVVKPTRNETRYNARAYNFNDFDSKIIYITSACPKNYSFYEEFQRIVQQRAKGNKAYFACVLHYKTPIAEGLTKESYYEEERASNPETTFQMEYESKFLGSSENSAFPFDLVQSCRTLDNVEMEQPKGSKSRYVISLDIATSKAKGSDNSILMVHKFTERKDGSFARKIVHIRSYNGKPLDYLTEQVRIYYHVKFPNTEKIVYDARGIGDSFDRFFDKEWIDSESGKEYPPLVVDDEPLTNADAIQALHPFRAVNQLNQRIYTNLRVALEKQTIEIPMSSRIMKERQTGDNVKKISKEEFANYLEADALQIEMGNVVAKTGSGGNVLYDVPKSTMHKDRYSSLAMGNDYISELEKESIKLHKHGPVCVGVTGGFNDAQSKRIASTFRHF